jgi:hypothetical protein
MVRDRQQKVQFDEEPKIESIQVIEEVQSMRPSLQMVLCTMSSP